MHIYALPITGHLKDQSTNWIVLLKLLQCQKLVNEYAPEIIELLLQELQPDEICTELGLCSSGKKLLRGEKKKHMTVTPLTNICACVSLTWMAFRIEIALRRLAVVYSSAPAIMFLLVKLSYFCSSFCGLIRRKNTFLGHLIFPVTYFQSLTIYFTIVIQNMVWKLS